MSARWDWGRGAELNLSQGHPGGVCNPIHGLAQLGVRESLDGASHKEAEELEVPIVSAPGKRHIDFGLDLNAGGSCGIAVVS